MANEQPKDRSDVSSSTASTNAEKRKLYNKRYYLSRKEKNKVVKDCMDDGKPKDCSDLPSSTASTFAEKRKPYHQRYYAYKALNVGTGDISQSDLSIERMAQRTLQTNSSQMTQMKELPQIPQMPIPRMRREALILTSAEKRKERNKRYYAKRKWNGRCVPNGSQSAQPLTDDNTSADAEKRKERTLYKCILRYSGIKMTNSEINTTEFGTNVAGPNTDLKKPVLANKKVALQDVQNDNSNSTRNAAGPTAVHEKPVLAAKKVALQDVQNDNSNFTRNVAGPTTVNKEPVLAAKKVVLQDVQNDNSNVAGPTSVHKKAVLATKKVALQDVQNDNSNSTRNVAGPTTVHKEPVADACKTIGTKRVAPDHASSPILTNNGAHEFEGNRKKNVGQPKSGSLTQIQQEAGQISGKNVLNGSLVGPNQTASKPYVSRLKESNDEQWAERFIRLQNFIKQCDGSDHREHTQLLVRLSPSELCKHAVELEKRAIQLTIEEGKEMERMQALNILGTPLLTRNPIPLTQQKN
ncbi:hypothetical protein HanPI659440_Chr08g0287051 [Helianthus annuus]|nr:hypothetical protein HanPI659440_Chr08g0287051 [Helianthus annuus]